MQNFRIYLPDIVYVIASNSQYMTRIKHYTGISCFQSLMDKLYAYHHQSSKTSMGLDKSCVEVGIEMEKIGRVLNVRWSASSFRTLKTI